MQGECLRIREHHRSPIHYPHRESVVIRPRFACFFFLSFHHAQSSFSSESSSLSQIMLLQQFAGINLKFSVTKISVPKGNSDLHFDTHQSIAEHHLSQLLLLPRTLLWKIGEVELVTFDRVIAFFHLRLAPMKETPSIYVVRSHQCHFSES